MLNIAPPTDWVGRIVLALGILLALANSPLRAHEIDLKKAHETSNVHGTVLLSATVSGHESFLRVTLTAVHADDPNAKVIFTLGTPFYGNNETLSAKDGRWGRLVALQMYPGRWRFQSMMVAYWDPASPRTGEIRHADKLGVEFSVEPGQIRYLGNLDLLPTLQPGFAASQVFAALLFGLTGGGSAGGAVLRDEWVRDGPLFLAENPRLAQLDLGVRERPATPAPALELAIRERAKRGESLAIAALQEAELLGSAMLPDMQVLRLAPIQGLPTAAHIESLLQGGDPDRLARWLEWADDPDEFKRLGPMVDQKTLHPWMLAAAERYGLRATRVLGGVRAAGLLRAMKYRDRVSPLDEAQIALWRDRARLLNARSESPQDHRLGYFVPTTLVEAYRSSASASKALLASADGQGRLVELGANAPADALGGALQDCERATGATCFLLMVDGAEQTGVCPLPLSNHPGRSRFAPAALPPATGGALEDKAWSQALGSSLGRGRMAVLPRAVVWSPGSKRAYGASGTCTSAYAAIRACKASGASDCELVLQDDRLTEGTSFAKDEAQRLSQLLDAVTRPAPGTGRPSP